MQDVRRRQRAPIIRLSVSLDAMHKLYAKATSKRRRSNETYNRRNRMEKLDSRYWGLGLCLVCGRMGSRKGEAADEIEWSGENNCNYIELDL